MMIANQRPIPPNMLNRELADSSLDYVSVPSSPPNSQSSNLKNKQQKILLIPIYTGNNLVFSYNEKTYLHQLKTGKPYSNPLNSEIGR